MTAYTVEESIEVTPLTVITSIVIGKFKVSRDGTYAKGTVNRNGAKIEVTVPLIGRE